MQPTHTILCIFSVLATRIKLCPPSAVVQVLEILGDGLSIWVSADREVFTDEDYTDKVDPIIPFANIAPSLIFLVDRNILLQRRPQTCGTPRTT